jgi:itaconate CoA-transferase
LQLLENADVLVQNLAPGAAARMGLGYEALSKDHNPKLIVCDISGYGDDGPYRDKKAYDLLIQSEAGFLSVTGTPEAPSKAGNSVADIAAGMYAYTSILSALLLRGKTGQGSHIDVSMLESLAEWMNYPHVLRVRRRTAAAAHRRLARQHLPLRAVPGRQRRRHGDAGPAERARVEAVLRGVLQRPKWQPTRALTATQAQRQPRCAEGADPGHLRQPHGRAGGGAAGRSQIANARMNDMAGLWAHPQLQARERWAPWARRPATVPALLPPGRSNAVRLPHGRRCPPWASTPRPSCANWATARPQIAALGAAGAI